MKTAWEVCDRQRPMSSAEPFSSAELEELIQKIEKERAELGASIAAARQEPSESSSDDDGEWSWGWNRPRAALGDAESGMTKSQAFRVLGLPAACTRPDVRRAYMQLARKHHPDKGGDESMFRLVQESYERVCAET